MTGPRAPPFSAGREVVAFRDTSITKFAAEHGMPAPDMVNPLPFAVDCPEEVDLTGFGAVIFAGGFRPGYRSWVDIPDAFDDLGFPIQSDGASDVVPGLYFVGTHFLRTRRSALFIGAGDDATMVADTIAASA